MSWIQNLIQRFPTTQFKKMPSGSYHMKCPWHELKEKSNPYQMILYERRNMFTCSECGIFGHKQFLKEKLIEIQNKEILRQRRKPYQYTVAPLKPAQKPFTRPPQTKPEETRKLFYQKSGKDSDVGVFSNTNQLKNSDEKV